MRGGGSSRCALCRRPCPIPAPDPSVPPRHFGEADPPQLLPALCQVVGGRLIGQLQSAAHGGVRAAAVLADRLMRHPKGQPRSLHSRKRRRPPRLIEALKIRFRWGSGGAGLRKPRPHPPTRPATSAASDSCRPCAHTWVEVGARPVVPRLVAARARRRKHQGRASRGKGRSPPISLARGGSGRSGRAQADTAANST